MKKKKVSQPKNKKFQNIELVSSKDVWRKNKKGEFRLKTDEFKFIGKVDTKLSSVVSMPSITDKTNTFVENFHELPKKTKNDITKYFLDKVNGKPNKKQVVYLVQKEK